MAGTLATWALPAPGCRAPQAPAARHTGCGRCGTAPAPRAAPAARASGAGGAARRRRLAPPPAAAKGRAAKDDGVGAADKEEGEDAVDPYHEENVYDRAIRMEREREERDRAAGRKPVLRPAQQYGLQPMQPREAAAPEQRAAEAAAAEAAAEGGGGAAQKYSDLLEQLPGLQRQLRAAAQERVGLAVRREQRAADQIEYADERYPRRREPPLTEWDLRAKMEKRRRQRREMQEWNERRARVGQYPSLGADWRTDVRCAGTGDPTDPEYREWTHKQVWDLITLGGRNADPRDVELFVRNPLEVADAPAQGAEYRPDPEEYLESLGRLIQEDEVGAIAGGDKDGEAALLAAEFTDFDDDLVGSADFDADYAAAEGDAGF